MENVFNKTFVFLGPSLQLSEAKKILPNAYFLPPVQSGDILRVLRLKPSVIGIIDGYFENTAAVWHKEILYAIEQGVRVIGGGSMGALRASELISYGMIPVGRIANNYLSGITNDDDDVALLHSTIQSSYSNLTESMVNIRDTLLIAHKKNIINKDTFNLINQVSKNIFYQKRTWEIILKISYQNGADITQVNKFNDWLTEKKNFQDVKRKDAILILKTIDNLPPIESNKSFKLNRSAFFRALQKNVMCRPFSSYQTWLSIQEKTALAARYLGSTYRMLRRLAYLLAACYSLSKQRQRKFADGSLAIPEDGYEFVTKEIFADTEWGNINDCSNAQKNNFLKRMNTLCGLFKQENQSCDLPGSAITYLLLLMRLSGDYSKLKKIVNSSHNYEDAILSKFMQNEPKKYRLMSCMSYCWWFIERYALKLGLQPDFEALQDYSDSFRFGNNLQTAETMKKWLIDNDLDLNSYQYFMSANFRLKFLVFENNLDILDFSLDDTDNWWLLDALWLSGFYEEAKKLLTDTAKLEKLKKQAKNETTNLEEYAISLDFIGGEYEFFNEKF